MSDEPAPKTEADAFQATSLVGVMLPGVDNDPKQNARNRFERTVRIYQLTNVDVTGLVASAVAYGQMLETELKSIGGTAEPERWCSWLEHIKTEHETNGRTGAGGLPQWNWELYCSFDDDVRLAVEEDGLDPSTAAAVFVDWSELKRAELEEALGIPEGALEEP